MVTILNVQHVTKQHLKEELAAIRRKVADLEAYNKTLERAVDENEETLKKLMNSTLRGLAVTTPEGRLSETNRDLVALTLELEKHSEALRQSEERFRSIFESAAEGIAISGSDGNITLANPAFVEMLGYETADEVVGMPAVDVYFDSQDTKRVFSELMKKGSVKNQEFLMKRKDGAPLPVLGGATLIRDRENQITRTQAIVTDNTQRKKRIELLVEQADELRRANVELAAVNKELDAFNYSVSHDLRAPLRSIDGFSLALLEDCAEQLDDRGKEHLKRVRAATQHMGCLIDDLLNLSHITRSSMRRETVDLSGMARAIAAGIHKTQPDRNVDFAIADGLVASVDANLLNIVLENLLSNAFKFTRTHHTARIEFGLTQCDGKAAFYVSDDGVGFDMAYADRLFEPFQRLHSAKEFPGNGIGLALVQHIIRRHGGTVWAEAEPEKGATFYFTIG